MLSRVNYLFGYSYTWQAICFSEKAWVDTRVVFILGLAYTWKFMVAFDDKLTYAGFSFFKCSMLSLKYACTEFVTWDIAKEKLDHTHKAVYGILFVGTMSFSHNNKRSFPGSKNSNKMVLERYLMERSGSVRENLLVFLFW